MLFDVLVGEPQAERGAVEQIVQHVRASKQRILFVDNESAVLAGLQNLDRLHGAEDP